MEKGADDAIDPNGIHGKTWDNFDNDLKIIYIITDIQSRLRSKINLFYEAYIQVKTEGDLIGSYDTVGTDTEGQKQIMANEHGIDIAVSSVYQDCMSVSRIVDIKAMRLAVALFSAIRLDQLKQLIIAFSEEYLQEGLISNNFFIREFHIKKKLLQKLNFHIFNLFKNSFLTSPLL